MSWISIVKCHCGKLWCSNTFILCLLFFLHWIYQTSVNYLEVCDHKRLWYTFEWQEDFIFKTRGSVVHTPFTQYCGSGWSGHSLPICFFSWKSGTILEWQYLIKFFSNWSMIQTFMLFWKHTVAIKEDYFSLSAVKTLQMKDWEAESDIHCRFIITHMTAVYCIKPAFRAYTMIHTHRTLLTLPQYPALLADLCHVYQNLI